MGCLSEVAGQGKRVLNYRIGGKRGREEEGERGRERERKSDYMLVWPSLFWRREDGAGKARAALCSKEQSKPRPCFHP